METKKEQLKKAIEEFRKSDQNKKDYMNLIVVSHRVLKQGSGLLWSDVEEVLEDVLN